MRGGELDDAERMHERRSACGRVPMGNFWRERSVCAPADRKRQNLPPGSPTRNTPSASCAPRIPQEATPLPVLGQVLEILPDSDPTAPGFQGKISGRILFHGAAAPRAPGHGLLPDSSQALITHTDNVGHFAMRLPSPGVWILKSVPHDRRPGPRSRLGQPLGFLVFRF